MGAAAGTGRGLGKDGFALWPAKGDDASHRRIGRGPAEHCARKFQRARHEFAVAGVPIGGIHGIGSSPTNGPSHWSIRAVRASVRVSARRSASKAA